MKKGINTDETPFTALSTFYGQDTIIVRD